MDQTILPPQSLQEGKDQRRRAVIILHIMIEESQRSWKCQESQGALPRQPQKASRDLSSGENELIGGDPVQWK